MTNKIEDFVKTTPADFVERCAAQANELNKILYCEAFKLVVEMWDMQEEAYRHAAVEAHELQEREEARSNLMAIRRLRQVPYVLLETAKAIVSTPPSTDGIPPDESRGQ